MRGSEVKIGGAYVCRVSGELCRVEIVRELFARRGYRFAAMNCRTGRMITVTPARLRSRIPETGEVRPATVTERRECRPIVRREALPVMAEEQTF